MSEQDQVIKITYRKIIDLAFTGDPRIPSKLAQLERKPLPRKLAFWIGRVMDKFDDELRGYNRQQAKLIEDNVVRDDKGNKVKAQEFPDGRVQWKIDPEKRQAHDEAIDTLLDTEIDIHVYRMKIKLSWIRDFKTMPDGKQIPSRRVSPKMIRTLLPIADIDDDLPDSDNEPEELDKPTAQPQP